MPTYRVRGDSVQALVRVKRGGVIVHAETKTFKAATPARARALAESWAEGVEARIREVGVAARRKAGVNLDKLLLDYRDKLVSYGEIRRTRLMELDQLATEFKGVKLSSLSPATFTEFAERRRREGAGPATVLHNLSTLSAVLGAARPMFNIDVRADHVAEATTALKRMGVIQRSASRSRRVTEAEIQSLVVEFERVKMHPSTVIPMHLIVPLAVALPRRLGELCKMRWEDYDKRRKRLLLRDVKHPTKLRDELVPVPAAAVKILASLPITDQRILPYNSESVSAAFQRAVGRLNLEDLRFHDLRHEGITRLFEVERLPIQDVAMISGHTNWSTLRRYTHPDVDRIAEQLNAGIPETQETDPEPSRP